MSKSININITENMQHVVDGMPESFASVFLTSLLDMACDMVLNGDITADVGDTLQLYLIAHIQDYSRTLQVNLVPAKK